MANVPKRLQSDDIENLAIGMEQLSQEVQDILAGGGGFLPAAAGDLVTYDSNAASVAILSVGSNGQVLTADSTAHKGMKWADAAAGSPLTTKGDILGHSTVDARVPIGTNGQVLTADSGQALGLKWADPSGGSLPTPTAKGDIITYDSNAAAPGILARGTNHYLLSADSTQDKGLIWVAPPETDPVLNCPRTVLINGDTWNVTNNTLNQTLYVGVISGGPYATLTINLTPGSPAFRVLHLCLTGGVVALTVSSGYGTVYGAPTSCPNEGMSMAFVYDGDLGGWYPYQ